MPGSIDPAPSATGSEKGGGGGRDRPAADYGGSPEAWQEAPTRRRGGRGSAAAQARAARGRGASSVPRLAAPAAARCCYL